MRTYILKLPAAEVVHLLRAETEAAHGAPELDIGAPEKEYLIEEEFDRSPYGLHDGQEFDLVTSITTLTIEPRVESGYWILEAVIMRALGPIPTSQERALVRKELTLDEFEAELRAAGQKRVTVRLQVQTPAVRQDFDRWLADMRTRHPWKPSIQQHAAALQPEIESTTEGASVAVEGAYRVKEAVAVFRDSGMLEAAVDELEISGFDRAAMSVLATNAKAMEQVERFYRSFREIEDSGRVARGAFVSRDSRTEGKAATVGIPIYIGGFAGAAAVAAAGGALALTIAATIAGGAVGAGLGAILAAALARHHTQRVQEQLDKGGLVLWVSAPNPDVEKRAVAILERMGARDVHVHEIERQWNPSDIPLVLTQADPLLQKDPR
jgi:hypothetical protein